MIYRHTGTGATLETECNIQGEFWEEVVDSAPSKKNNAPAKKEVAPEKEVEPKKEK